jgi:phosphotriesterase-related protein
MSTEQRNPTIPNMAGTVMTVNGPMDPDKLGMTLMHEHIFFDLRRVVSSRASPFGVPSRPVESICLETLDLARDGKLMDNVFMRDENVAISEVLDYKASGGGTIVDVSPIELVRDTLGVRRVSQATGVNIVMGTGFFAWAFPEDMDRRTVEDLTQEIVEDVAVGIEESGIRSGIIGEVGIEGNPLKDNEIKAVRAAGRASKATGAAITFHRGGVDREKLQVLSMLGEEGADLSRVIMGHSDWIANDIPLLKEILETGAYVQFDFLGRVEIDLYWQPAQEKGPPYSRADSATCARTILELLNAGYEDRIMLSHDAGQKTRLKRYGGAGLTFVPDKFLPHLKSGGVQESQIQKMMVENPKRVLTLAAPG